MFLLFQKLQLSCLMNITVSAFEGAKNNHL